MRASASAVRYTSDAALGLSDARLLEFFRSMLRIRLIEEEIAARYAEQEMRCPVHLSVGQEAVATGICGALGPKDQIVSTHRCHSHYLAKGGNLPAMLAELYGKATGCCGGRGGSMHLFDSDAGVLASVPIVASSVALGVGAALAFKQRGEPNVCVAFLGDASIEEGVAHESANFAAVQMLPVVFVIENNGFSVYTPLQQRQPPRPLTAFAQAHGIPGEQIDGNDVVKVFESGRAAVERARAGGGPSVIVADTYRWREHCGPAFDNDLGYRSAVEAEAWQARCPVLACHGLLQERGLAAGSALERELRLELQEAFALAKAAPFPDPTDMEGGLYA
jgi:pyruvate dehydrogenase E1 component alpha subunit